MSENKIINKESNPSFLNSFLDYSLVILNKSPNTVKEYGYDLALFFKFIKQHFNLCSEKNIKNIDISDFSINDLKKITTNDIFSFLYFITTTYNSKPVTRARKIASIRAFFNYAYKKENLIASNPAYDIETPKLGKRIPKYLSLEESKKLLDVTQNDDTRNSKRDYAIITLFLNCGLRLSELINININNIDFTQSKFNVIGKGNKERTIYLNSACVSAIKQYLTVRPKNGIKHEDKDALFLSERKERISRRTVQYAVKKELKRAGLDISKISVHKLRHTAATLMYQTGKVDIRALQELLGHESIATTEIYTHVDNAQIRNAVEENPLANL